MPLAVWIWLALLVLFIIVEALTTALVSIWFIAGSIAAGILAAFDARVWLQLTVFVVVSVSTVLLLRPMIKRRLGLSRVPTNADMVLGKTCVVKETVNNTEGTGRVTVDGHSWSARSYGGDILRESDRAVVHSIDGAKLVIIPVKEN